MYQNCNVSVFVCSQAQARAACPLATPEPPEPGTPAEGGEDGEEEGDATNNTRTNSLCGVVLGLAQCTDIWCTATACSLSLFAAKRKRGRPARSQPQPEPGTPAEGEEEGEEDGEKDEDTLNLTGTVGKRERKALHPAVSCVSVALYSTVRHITFTVLYIAAQYLLYSTSLCSPVHNLGAHVSRALWADLRVCLPQLTLVQ